MARRRSRPDRRPAPALRAFIEMRLREPSLCPDDVARGNSISTRHLHRLFRQAGTSFSTFVRDLRLARCRADLADPRCAGLSVTAIAFRWGFSDLRISRADLKPPTASPPVPFATGGTVDFPSRRVRCRLRAPASVRQGAGLRGPLSVEQSLDQRGVTEHLRLPFRRCLMFRRRDRHLCTAPFRHIMPAAVRPARTPVIR